MSLHDSQLLVSEEGNWCHCTTPNCSCLFFNDLHILFIRNIHTINIHIPLNRHIAANKATEANQRLSLNRAEKVST